MRRQGILFLISAASGAGKTTLCDGLRAAGEFYYSISCTTRAPRPGEIDGQSYHFIDEATFRQRVDGGFFLEHATVHGHSYGTPLHPIKEALQQGRDALLAIDVQGAAQIRAHPDPVIRGALVDVFLTTPSFAELEKRLRSRATDDEPTIRRRLDAARGEIAHWPSYRYVLLSGTREQDCERFQAIIAAERCRSSRLTLEPSETGEK